MAYLCSVQFKKGSFSAYYYVPELHFSKDRYRCYTYAWGRVITDADVSDASEIACYVNDTLIHLGMADEIERVYENGRWTVTFKSRGFSALLSQNEPVPNMNYGVNLETLGKLNTALPNVTYEASTKSVNYIYVKEKSTIWDAITAYAVKAYGNQPYITEQNKVTATIRSGADISYSGVRVLRMGEGCDRRTMLSEVYMADADGKYSYSKTDSSAAAAEIVRRKYYPLDRQWLSSPATGLQLKLDIAKRRAKYKFFTYVGYKGEEILDNAKTSFTNFDASGKIGGIEIDVKDGIAATTIRIFE